MYVMGDIHGQIDKMRAALMAAGLIDYTDRWTGEDTTLWFMGDYFDRGPDGIAAVDLIRTLQTEATAAGGRVGALLGNHDVLILAAQRFGERPRDRAGWLRDLPAMVVDGGRLLAHADATFYQVYGRSVEGVNRHINAILHSGDAAAWDLLLDYFSQRRAFQDRDLGPARVGRVLARYGGRQLVHGHTPIAKLSGCRPEDVTCALVYAGGLAVDVDAGMYLGGRGFVTCLPEIN